MGVQQQILELRRQILALKTRLGQVVITGTTNPAAHASTHADAGSDPVNVTTLDGFPGGGTTFLRDDGTFATPAGTGITQLTSDVTAGPGSGSQAATIANDAVTNAKAANMAQSTIKGRAAAAGTGDPTDLTANEVSTILDTATDPFLRTSDASGAGLQTTVITWVVDGGGLEIPLGPLKPIRIPVNGTLKGWTLLADQAGAVVIDVWKDVYANYPPDNSDSITNGNEPEIAASDDNAEDTNITDWTTTAVAAGDVLMANVDSVTAFTWVVLELTMEVT